MDGIPVTTDSRPSSTSLRVDRETGDLGGWELARRLPAPRLSEYVREYQGYVERAPQPSRRRHLPSPEVSLVLNLGVPFRMIDPRDGSTLAVRRSFVAGLHDRFAVVESSGETSCLQIDLSPLGAYRLFGVPMHELSRTTVEVDDLFGSSADRLLDQLADASSWSLRFDVLDAFLAGRFASAAEPPAAVAWAWGTLVDSSGAIPVRALAADLGVSRKHVAHQFREYVGLPAKTMARVLRFQRSSDLLALGEARSLAALAAASGYADQAHMSREYRQLSGWAPSRYARERRIEGLGITES